MEEKLTYEILQEYKKEQDRLISEREMRKPQIIYGLSTEGEAAVKRGRTLEVVTKEISEKYVVK
jgi:hypothetical protein